MALSGKQQKQRRQAEPAPTQAYITDLSVFLFNLYEKEKLSPKPN